MNYIPQRNIEAEIAILGAVFLDNDCLLNTDLMPEDFYKPSHRDLFKGMQELAKAGNPIDLISVEKHLGTENVSFTELSEIVSHAVTTANIKYHSRLVKEASAARKLQQICLTTLSDLTTGNYEVLDALVARINGSLGDILTYRGGEITNLHDVAQDVLAYVERRMERKDAISGVPSGFNGIDKITDGFQPGEPDHRCGTPGHGEKRLCHGNCTERGQQGLSGGDGLP